ncbi:MAG: hypothetical protein P8X91_01225 [Candidatus Bathyarchaeota archaeon]
MSKRFWRAVGVGVIQRRSFTVMNITFRYVPIVEAVKKEIIFAL